MRCEIYVNAVPMTWTVDDDGPADFLSIQEAINSPKVEHGDTIFVRAGIYYEHVIVNKNVFLVGEDRDSTIVDGNRTGSVISITANNVNISGFTIQHSGYEVYDSGIYARARSSGHYISHNTITNNNGGISFYSSDNNVVSGNTIINNLVGINLVEQSYYNSISRNNITSNDEGVEFLWAHLNIVSGNIISSNDFDGISFFFSTGNVVLGNTITNNSGGMRLFSSNNNVIYRNNFDNTHQVQSEDDPPSLNVWDNGDEGNYWSNYEGQDLNEDGIGDTSYNINVNNRDNHPLMGRFSDFEVPLEREMYHVTTICNSTISGFRFEIGPETGNKIIRFNVIGEDGAVGFCRITIPTELMNYPFIVIVDGEGISPTFLDATNETLYFTYILSNRIITIISSKVQHLYYELLKEHEKLQTYLNNLNATYYNLLNNYFVLLGNYNQLIEDYSELNNSYLEHLLDYSKNVHNVRNLMYIFATTTAIFIITTVYLSKHAHADKTSARK